MPVQARATARLGMPIRLAMPAARVSPAMGRLVRGRALPLRLAERGQRLRCWHAHCRADAGEHARDVRSLRVHERQQQVAECHRRAHLVLPESWRSWTARGAALLPSRQSSNGLHGQRMRRRGLFAAARAHRTAHCRFGAAGRAGRRPRGRDHELSAWRTRWRWRWRGYADLRGARRGPALGHELSGHAAHRKKRS